MELVQTIFTPRCSENEIITFLLLTNVFKKYEMSSFAVFSTLSSAS